MNIKTIGGILLGVISYEILRCTNSLMSKLFHDVLLTLILLFVFCVCGVGCGVVVNDGVGCGDDFDKFFCFCNTCCVKICVFYNCTG